MTFAYLSDVPGAVVVVGSLLAALGLAARGRVLRGWAQKP